MKLHTRDQLKRLLDFQKPQLLAIINAGSAGKKWHCGAGGNSEVAKRIKVRTRDLESLVSACWNAIAHQSCVEGDKEGPDVYRRITGLLLDEMDAETQSTVMNWAETVEWKDEWTQKDEQKLWG